MAVVLAALVLAGCGTTVSPPDASGSGSPTAPASLVSDPASLVDPMAGTGTGGVAPGAVAEFPGADLPFGMIQWSPDTTPNASGSGAGYSYRDSHISGFSLTHLSGSGARPMGTSPSSPPWDRSATTPNRTWARSHTPPRAPLPAATA